MTNTFWYLAKTKPNRERYAQKNAERQPVCLRTWLPVIETEQGREEILFPSYLFVMTHGQWHFLTGTYGISSVVTFGEQAALVPHRVMRSLRAMVKQGRVVLPNRNWKKGTEVKVKGGTFAGFEGLYQNMSPERRVCILLSIMGRKVPVEIERRHVQAIAA